MSSNLISNKTLSNSVIPAEIKPTLLGIFTTSTTFTVPNWYYGLTGILVSGGAGGLGKGPIEGQDGDDPPNTLYFFPGGAGGGSGAVIVFPLNVRPGAVLTVTIGAGGPGNGTYANGGNSSLSADGKLYIVAKNINGGSTGSISSVVNNADAVVASTPNLSGLQIGRQAYPFGIDQISADYVGTVSTTASFAGVSAFGYKGGNTSNTQTYVAPNYVYAYGRGGGGGGYGSVAGDNGGNAKLITFPNYTGELTGLVLGGGGGSGGGYITYIASDPPSYYSTGQAGGTGGAATNFQNSTQTVGGSGGSSSTPTSSATDGAINTGSGGGGNASTASYEISGAGYAGNGGSGIFILYGLKAYPFSGKPI